MITSIIFTVTKWKSPTQSLSLTFWITSKTTLWHSALTPPPIPWSCLCPPRSLLASVPLRKAEQYLFLRTVWYIKIPKTVLFPEEHMAESC